MPNCTDVTPCIHRADSGVGGQSRCARSDLRCAISHSSSGDFVDRWLYRRGFLCGTPLAHQGSRVCSAEVCRGAESRASPRSAPWRRRHRSPPAKGELRCPSVVFAVVKPILPRRTSRSPWPPCECATSTSARSSSSTTKSDRSASSPIAIWRCARWPRARIRMPAPSAK